MSMEKDGKRKGRKNNYKIKLIFEGEYLNGKRKQIKLDNYKG